MGKTGFVVIALVAIVAPWLSPHEYLTTDFDRLLLPPQLANLPFLVGVTVTLAGVDVTANMPSKRANADTGSIPKVNGNRITRPMMPPRPGTAPSQIPSSTPRT